MNQQSPMRGGGVENIFPCCTHMQSHAGTAWDSPYAGVSYGQGPSRSFKKAMLFQKQKLVASCMHGVQFAGFHTGGGGVENLGFHPPFPKVQFPPKKLKIL